MAAAGVIWKSRKLPITCPAGGVNDRAVDGLLTITASLGPYWRRIRTCAGSAPIGAAAAATAATDVGSTDGRGGLDPAAGSAIVTSQPQAQLSARACAPRPHSTEVFAHCPWLSIRHSVTLRPVRCAWARAKSKVLSSARVVWSTRSRNSQARHDGAVAVAPSASKATTVSVSNRV